MEDAGWVGDVDHYIRRVAGAPEPGGAPRAPIDWARLSEAVRRAGGRQLAHARRLAIAGRRAGPGRLAGAVISAEARGDDLVIGGWAHLPAGAIDVVVVSINGRVVGVAPPVDPTPELPWLGPVTARSAAAGWTAVAPDAAFGPTELPHTVAITAYAVLRQGFTEPLIPLTVQVPGTPPLAVGTLDVPAEGDTVVRPFFYARGWLLPRAELDRVEVTIGDQPPVRARLHAIPRPDVAAAAEDPLAVMAGWEAAVELPSGFDPAEPVTVEAIARSGERAVVLGRVQVRVEASATPPPADVDWLQQLARRADQPEAPTAGDASEGLRLAVFTHHLGLGGGQLYLQDLLRHLLVQPDVDCLVVSQADGVLRGELEALGAAVHVAGMFPLEPAAYESRLRELTGLCREVDTNMVLVNTTGSFIGADLARRARIPAVWAIHESFTLDAYFLAAFGLGEHAHVRARAADGLRSAAAVVFEADATRRLYAEHGDPRRYLKLDYGIPLAEIEAYRAAHGRAELRTSLGFDRSDVVVVCLGTFEPRKAQVSLLFAFEQIADRFPESTLVLVGDTGSPYAAGVHEIAKGLDLQDRVRLVGVTRDTYAWYHAADVFVSASDLESLPRSVLEAMAFEVPVVAASVFGLPELITHGVDGVLFEPSDVGALASALEDVLAMDPERRVTLGRAAADMVRRTRDDRAFAAAYRRLFDALLSDPLALPADVLARRS